MAHSDAAAEWLRLTAHYRRMSDGELLSLARNPAALTEAAQQVLKAEFSARRHERSATLARSKESPVTAAARKASIVPIDTLGPVEPP